MFQLIKASIVGTKALAVEDGNSKGASWRKRLRTRNDIVVIPARCIQMTRPRSSQIKSHASRSSSRSRNVTPPAQRGCSTDDLSCVQTNPQISHASVSDKEDGN